MKHELTCIICPRGCGLTVDIDDNNISVSGNACPKGREYGITESTNPTRTVTSVVRVKNRDDVMVSVKTETPILKSNIFKFMEIIRKMEVNAPIELGDVICDNVFGARVVATKEIK